MSKLYYALSSSFLALLPIAASASSKAASGGHQAPEGISDPVPGWDHLWHELMIDIWAIGIFFALVTLWFMIRYARRSPDEEGRPVVLSTAAMFGWALVPTFAFMADDFYLGVKGWDLWNDYRNVPENAYEIRSEASMWQWTFIYPNGAEGDGEEDGLVVPEKTPILMTMTSNDTIHSLYLFGYKVKEDSMPGRMTYLWFYSGEAGKETILTCTEYCGMGHSQMYGKVRVLSKRDFKRWVKNKGGV